MIAMFRQWCLGTRLLVAGTAGWLVFLAAHALLAGRWWFWLVVEVMPPIVLVLVPVAMLAVTPLAARQVRWWIAGALVLALAGGAVMSGVDVRAKQRPASGNSISVFSWSTDVWDMSEDSERFYRYLRHQDADIYLLQEYLYWSQGPVRVNHLARLRMEFPAHEIRVEGELVTLSRYPIVATHPRGVGDGAAWYWHGSKVQRTDLQIGAQVVSVYNVHLQPPLRVEHVPLSLPFYSFVYRQYHSRHHELAELREDLAGNRNPIVIAGDFNSAWMGTLIDLDEKLVQHDPVTWMPWLASWPTSTYSFPRLWRLDWLFATGDIRVHDYRFARSLSDHAAQEIRFSLKEDDNARS